MAGIGPDENGMNEPATKAELGTSLEILERRTLERLEKVETTLLLEFRKWARRIESNLKVSAIEISTLKERVSELEDRLEHLKP